MTLNLYSVKDKYLDFTGPLMFKDDKVAIRWFEAQMKQKIEQDRVDPKYWDLYLVGTFNTETGEITGSKQHEIQLIREGEGIE